MCIAILARCGKSITEEQIDNCWRANSDGAGFAYSKDNRLVVVKELKNVEKFKRLYFKHLPEAVLSPMLIHFRIRTHGEVSIANTQPIQISKNCVFIHNGVISCVPNHKVHSDTVMYSKLVLSKWQEGFQSSETIRDVIRASTGGSKLVFLQTNGNAYIVNDKAGDWDDGIWYSNWSHKSYLSKKTSAEPLCVYRGGTYNNPAIPDRIMGGVGSTNTAWHPTGNAAPAQRLLALPKSLTLTELPLVPGEVSCSSCYEDFSVGDEWFEVYEKHMVCKCCMSQFEENGIFQTEQGVFTSTPLVEESKDEDTLYWEGRLYGGI